MVGKRKKDNHLKVNRKEWLQYLAMRQALLISLDSSRSQVNLSLTILWVSCVAFIIAILSLFSEYYNFDDIGQTIFVILIQLGFFLGFLYVVNKTVRDVNKLYNIVNRKFLNITILVSDNLEGKIKDSDEILKRYKESGFNSEN